MNFKKGRLIIAIVAFLVLIIMGCSGTNISQEKKVKKALKKAYNEDFIIHEIDNSGLDCEATVSPVNNPEILFTVTVLPDCTIENSLYFNSYVSHLMCDTVEDDLHMFFPDSYIRMEEVCIRWKDDSSDDFRNMTLEEIIDNSDAYKGPIASGCYLEIYVNKEGGSTKEYKKEYEYFTKQIDDYIKQKKMLPVTVTIYYVDKEVLDRVEQYFKNDLDWDNTFEKKVLGVDNYKHGIVNTNDIDLGSPPNISFSFNKDLDLFIDNYSEYERRRKEIENVK